MKPFAKSPITEAVIDIQIEPSPNLTLDQLSAFQPAGYSSPKNQFLFQGQFQVGAQPAAAAMQHQIGFIFESDNHKKLLQTRINGFTFSYLAPYDRWEVFREEARTLWEQYSATARPVKIVRIGVRYINRIEIPLPILDFKDWLRTYPEVAEGVGPNLSGFFMQVQVPQPDLEALAILNETIAPSADPEKVVIVLLDIDLARVDNLPAENKALWNLFDEFRVRKNKIFIECITKKTEELFQ
jgi:uncharacterized protein (TIGR04255 family)